MSYQPGDEYSGKTSSCGAQMDWGERCSECGEFCGEATPDYDEQLLDAPQASWTGIAFGVLIFMFSTGYLLGTAYYGR